MNNLSLFGIFLEGLLSFFSPCVLPLIPLYISYLGGENRDNKKNLIINTLLFVLGIMSTFIIFGLSVSFIKDYIIKYQEIISIIGGTIIIIFALHELGLINISFLNQELSFKDKFKFNNISYFKAYLFGLVFSFAWTPCIGPMFANALLLSMSETNGILYLILYALGLIIPFVITGILSDFVLDFINNKKDISKYVLKIAGIIMLCFGIYMIYNSSKNIVNYKDTITNYETESSLPVLEKTYKDSNDNEVNLLDYKDKYVYVNFIASWCTYCRSEMPEYKSFCENNDEIACLYVMSPLVSNEGDVDSIKKYIEDQNIEVPVIIDTKGELLRYCNVSAFPTLAVIAPETNYLDAISGAMDEEGFNYIHSQAIELYKQYFKK